MLKKLQKKSEGFTIIEVMIVLAIAGLILLIVFLAVPALQRNSRNTQRKNDVTQLLAAAGTYETNNNGKVPTSAANVSDYKPGYYAAFADADILTGAQNAIGSDTIKLVTGAKCDTANVGKTLAGASRQVAVQYQIESSSGLTAACQDS